ncbi:MAG: hypothetical protein U0736_16175 [Gemmataceae bacterium]
MAPSQSCAPAWREHVAAVDGTGTLLPHRLRNVRGHVQADLVEQFQRG